MGLRSFFFFFCLCFFFNDTATTEIYTLSLHDALPIFLLGVDPDKVSYFFEDMEGMKPYCDRLYKRYRKQGMTQYENMVPKGNKFNTIDVYLYALKDYLSRKRDVNLFIGFKNNMLHPGIPSYFKE